MCTGTGCASDIVINTLLADASFGAGYVNTYFDSGDYVTPVKYFLDDTSFWNLEPDKRKKSDLRIRKSSAELHDDFI